jgi:ferrochelatase
VERVFEVLSARPWIPEVRVIDDFFADKGFIGAQAALASETLASFRADHVVMSFHGLPESHMRAISPGHCLEATNCCASVTAANRYCYRAQCFATARLLASQLSLPAEKYTVSFQSRLGRVPWIKPYTDELLPELAKKGVKRLAIMAPSFVSDCLETIEELGIRAREDWQASGGEDFALIPCVNTDARWVRGLSQMITSMVSATES